MIGGHVNTEFLKITKCIQRPDDLIVDKRLRTEVKYCNDMDQVCVAFFPPFLSSPFLLIPFPPKVISSENPFVG